MGHETTLPNDERTIEEHTQTIFERFDQFHKGFLTVQDFLACCLDVSKDQRRSPRASLSLSLS